MKKFFITIGALSLTTASLAQNLTNEPLPQKTVVVKKIDKEKVEEFHKQVKAKIEKHRIEMKSKKENLDNEKEALKNEIKNNKINGKLSEEQKNLFKTKLDIIDNKAMELKKENILFLEKIDKEREEFFNSIKNK